MTITSGAFDSFGIPQGHRNRLDDLDDVDVAEVKDGNTILLRDGRWIPGSGNEVAVQNTQPTDLGVELWINIAEADPPPALDTASGDLRYINADGDDTKRGILTMDNNYIVATGTTLTQMGYYIWETAGGIIRGLALRNNADLGHAAGAGLTVVNDGYAVSPLTVGNATQPYQAVNKILMESVSTVPFTYQDGWSSYGPPFGVAQLEKAANGIVTVSGIFSHSGKVITASGAYQLGTVPAGYRPANQMLVIGWVGASGLQQSTRFDITASGNVSFVSSAAMTAVAASFEGISWRAVN